MLSIDNKGYVYISRCEYLFLSDNQEDEKKMRDGTIIARIDPYATKDIEDAKKIFKWILNQVNKKND